MGDRDRLERLIGIAGMLTLVSNGPAIGQMKGFSGFEVAAQYQAGGRLSTFPKNTATFTGKLLIVSSIIRFVLKALFESS
jgi:hypothetical protein